MAEVQTVDAPTAAKVIDVGLRHFLRMVSEGLIPKHSRGRFELTKVVHAYIKHLRVLAQGTTISLTDERTRLTRFQADNEEMKKKQLSGELFEAEAVMKLWERHIMDCRSRLLALPTKISPVAFACKTIQEVQAAAEKLVHEALNELKTISVSDYTKSVDADAEPEPKKKAKPKPKPKPKKKAKKK